MCNCKKQAVQPSKKSPKIKGKEQEHFENNETIHKFYGL